MFLKRDLKHAFGVLFEEVLLEQVLIVEVVLVEWGDMNYGETVVQTFSMVTRMSIKRGAESERSEEM